LNKSAKITVMNGLTDFIFYKYERKISLLLYQFIFTCFMYC
jgi:hypothetical protein